MKLPHIPKWMFAISAIGTGVGVTVLLKDTSGGPKYEGEERIPGKTVLITGANTGLGKATAHELAKRGGRVIMGCRDLDKCEEARKEIMTATFNKNIVCKKLDLASLRSVQSFAQDMNRNEPRLDILINNAGVMGFRDLTLTEDGFEQALGVNHLGHFLLTNLLLDKLKISNPSRILNVSSTGHRRARIVWHDLNHIKDYRMDNAYNQSKLFNILFTTELARRLEGTGVTSYAPNPGISKTELGRNMMMNKSKISKPLLKPLWWMAMKTPEQGIQTILKCALDEDLSSESGKYYEDLRESEPIIEAKSKRNAYRLWLISDKWTSARLEEINSEMAPSELQSS